MPLTYEEIAETVLQLDRDFDPVRVQAKRRYDLYRAKKDPYVPEEIAREGKLRILSAHIDAAAQTIRADLMMNPTEFNCIPLARQSDGSIPKGFTSKAETVERATAVIWGRLNEGRRIDRDIIWHQLVSPYGVIILEGNDYTPPDQPEWMSDEDYVSLTDKYEKEWLPWTLSTPDPMTCSWLERGGRPVLFARRFFLTVKDVEKEYNHNRASMEPDKRLKLLQGKFEWVTDDYETHDAKRNVKSTFEEVEVLWLDDGEYISMCVRDPGDPETRLSENGGDTGRMLWQTPNPFGRVSAFVVPGNMTPAREPEDKYEPFLWPLMQTVDQMNSIRSTRATAARNLAGPHTYVSMDPEIVKLYLTRGEKLPTSVRWKKNETHYLLGEIKEVPSELSADWDKIEQAVNEELQRFLPSQFINVVDPAVLKAATATSILHAAEAGLRTYGPLMSAYDAAIRDIMDAMLFSLITHYADRDVYAYATGDEFAHGRNLTPGVLNKLNAKALDFPYKLTVKTRGMSQAQAAAQYDLVLRQWILPDGSKGPATLDDLIDAANYTDPVAQKMKLAKEGILDAIDPWIKEMAIMAARDEIYADSGIQLPIGPNNSLGMNPAQPPGPGGPGAGGPDAASPGDGAGGGQQANARIPASTNQTMNAPMINPAEGGSAPGMT
jgi:hypothetical protein